MALLAVLLPPIALLVMRKYWEGGIVLVLWLGSLAIAAITFVIPVIGLFFLAGAGFMWFASSFVAIFYLHERSTNRQFEHIARAITRASERIAPTATSDKGTQSSTFYQQQYSQKSSAAADTILGEDRAAAARRAYEVGRFDGLGTRHNEWLTASRWEEIKREWNNGAFLIGYVLLFVVLIFVVQNIPATWKDYSRERWNDGIVKLERLVGIRKDDFETFLACCNALCKIEGNCGQRGYVPTCEEYRQAYERRKQGLQVEGFEIPTADEIRRINKESLDAARSVIGMREVAECM